MSFELKFKLMTEFKNKDNEFNSDPIRHLIKSCVEALTVIKTIRNKTEESKMVKLGKYCIRTNDGVMDRPLRYAVRIIDTIDSENHYFLENFPEN